MKQCENDFNVTNKRKVTKINFYQKCMSITHQQLIWESRTFIKALRQEADRYISYSFMGSKYEKN